MAFELSLSIESLLPFVGDFGRRLLHDVAPGKLRFWANGLGLGLGAYSLVLGVRACGWGFRFFG